MKIIDKRTNEVLAEIIGGETMILDQALEFMGYEILDDGQLHDIDKNEDLENWYDDLDYID